MGEWTVGLFGCFSHCGLCIKSYLIPCVVYGQIAGALGKSCCTHGLFFCIPVLGCFVMGRTRGTLREKRDIPGGALGDFITSLFCTGCTLSQEAVELVVMARDKVKEKAGEELQDMGPEGEPDETEELAGGDTEQPKPEEEEEEKEEPVETDKIEIERE